MRAIGYTRVSSVEQLNGTSLMEQRKMIQAFCDMRGIQLVGIFSDAAISGGKALGERPEGSKMVQALNNGEADTVIICKLDRGFRSASDCLSNVETWEKQNISLVILNMGGQTIDTSSATARFFLTVMAGAAELEKNLIKERCNSGRAARKAEGRRIGSIPFGFTADEKGVLIDNPAEQAVLAEIKSLREKNYTLQQIADTLNSRGLTNRNGSAWNTGNISNLIRRAA